ncbi:MAG TPA: AlkA N-terminal domain-containing protein [Terriglobales bacterium]|nr:AlkA N-terminal domain-containing protein [Terriglobales bacterium]
MAETFAARYQAISSRDPRFDGQFYTAVKTTGVYCRPSCPARTPKAENVVFFTTAATAQAAGFRPCRRCRPDASPGSPEWDLRADLVARALRLIAHGLVDEVGVAGLARRLGTSERHVHRQMVAEVGVGPLTLARMRRAQTARMLLEASDLAITQVAFAAGYSSVRQFNDSVVEAFACTPTDVRRRGPDRGQPGGEIVLRLAHRRPYAAAPLLEFLAARAVPGVEAVVKDSYRRAIRLPRGEGVLTVTPHPDQGYLTARLRLRDLRDVTAAVARCRHQFDLDADPEGVAAVLGADAILGRLVAARPGLRVPGHVDGFELAVRAVLGQQVTVKGARTLASRLVQALGTPLASADGELTHLFPTALAVAEGDLSAVGLPAARVRALRALAAAVAGGNIDLDPGADRERTAAGLLAVPGIGAWTVAYVAMRALGDPDAIPLADLGLRRALAALGAPSDERALGALAERWRPWRSYAAMHLWAHAAGPSVPAESRLAG